jgi:Domain of unknown function (DUF6899)
MPYIPKFVRSLFDIHERKAQQPGELNYQMSQLVRSYLAMHGPTPGYQTYNDIIGVLECLKLEVYARLVRPYEDKKISENGDVFDL